jgi:type IV secretory pathway VirJ component
MKLLFAFIVCLMAVSGGYAQAPSSTVGPLTVPGLKEELVKYGPFGNVLVYRAEDQPKQVMIFISGDGGFDKPFINMVKTTTQPGVMVIAVDINTYLKHMAKQKNTCTYAAADLEGLSQFMQGHYRYPTYRVPVIAGYSSGATMGYAALVQGPPNTFAGVISMGFCSDMTSPKPFCKGAGLSNKEGGLKEPTAPKSYNNYVYGRVSSTVAPWTALQGAQDQLCPADKASAFMSATGNATMVSVPAVGHGFLVGAKWQAEFHKAFNSIVAKQEAAVGATAAPQSLADLPLVEAAVASPKGKPLAVIVTGDGGWAGIDREIGGALNEQGLNVVGLNSLQ